MHKDDERTSLSSLLCIKTMIGNRIWGTITSCTGLRVELENECQCLRYFNIKPESYSFTQTFRNINQKNEINIVSLLHIGSYDPAKNVYLNF